MHARAGKSIKRALYGYIFFFTQPFQDTTICLIRTLQTVRPKLPPPLSWTRHRPAGHLARLEGTESRNHYIGLVIVIEESTTRLSDQLK